jgi:hypothetical protein
MNRTGNHNVNNYYRDGSVLSVEIASQCLMLPESLLKQEVPSTGWKGPERLQSLVSAPILRKVQYHVSCCVGSIQSYIMSRVKCSNSPVERSCWKEKYACVVYSKESPSVAMTCSQRLIHSWKTSSNIRRGISCINLRTAFRSSSEI